jgi:hypothetical protein
VPLLAHAADATDRPLRARRAACALLEALPEVASKPGCYYVSSPAQKKSICTIWPLVLAM